MFKNRFEAGRKLAEKLQHFKNQDGVVVAVPRGGIQLGYEVAKALNLPLDVVLTKKLGHPFQPEYGIGAVSLEGRVLRDAAGISEAYIEKETAKLRKLLRQRYELYYKNCPPENLKDRIVLLVDDGIATGTTLLASIELIREQQPRWMVVAVPVASPHVVSSILSAVDEFVCLLTPEDFYAVGAYYNDFEQVSDQEVIQLLEKVRSQRAVAKR